MLLILRIHLRKIIHVRQKHRHLHHFTQIRACGFEYGAEVGDAEGGLVGDGAGREFAGGEGGELAGDVDGVGGGDCLGLEWMSGWC